MKNGFLEIVDKLSSKLLYCDHIEFITSVSLANPFTARDIRINKIILTVDEQKNDKDISNYMFKIFERNYNLDHLKEDVIFTLNTYDYVAYGCMILDIECNNSLILKLNITFDYFEKLDNKIEKRDKIIDYILKEK